MRAESEQTEIRGDKMVQPQMHENGIHNIKKRSSRRPRGQRRVNSCGDLYIDYPQDEEILTTQALSPAITAETRSSSID